MRALAQPLDRYSAGGMTIYFIKVGRKKKKNYSLKWPNLQYVKSTKFSHDDNIR